MKLDRALIQELDKDTIKQRIIRNLISMARDLGLQLVAEGVETKEEALFLIDAGVDLIQGFLIARPALEQEPILNLDWL